MSGRGQDRFGVLKQWAKGEKSWRGGRDKAAKAARQPVARAYCVLPKHIWEQGQCGS